MKKLLISAACASLLGTASDGRADEVRAEYGIGHCHYNLRENGTWWQAGRETNNQLGDGCYQLGFHWKFANSPWGARVSYVDMGRVKGNNIATNDDADADNFSLRCDPRTGRQCLSRYEGSGGAKGVTIGSTFESTFGSLSVGLEGGLFWFRSWWNEDVHHFEDCGWKVRTCGGIDEYDRATGDHYTPYAGITLRYGWVQLSARTYHNVYAQGRATTGDNRGDVGMFGKRAQQITVGFSIPF